MAWTVIRITTEQYTQLSALAQREGRTAPAQLRALLSESFKQAGEMEDIGGATAEFTSEDIQRFWAKVDRQGPDECWPWLGNVTEYGYGRFEVGRRSDGTSKHLRAHRVAYELEIGPIPEGLVPDHLCRNRACANPAHLEPVTIGENVLRGIGVTAINAAKTHCKNGHPFSEENTYINGRGNRECWACKRELKRKARSSEEVEEGGQTGAGVAETKVNAPEREDVGSNPVPGPQSDSRPTPPSSTSSRKTKCEHRVPPGSFCGRCDG